MAVQNRTASVSANKSRAGICSRKFRVPHAYVCNDSRRRSDSEKSAVYIIGRTGFETVSNIRENVVTPVKFGAETGYGQKRFVPRLSVKVNIRTQNEYVCGFGGVRRIARKITPLLGGIDDERVRRRAVRCRKIYRLFGSIGRDRAVAEQIDLCFVGIIIDRSVYERIVIRVLARSRSRDRIRGKLSVFPYAEYTPPPWRK